MNQYLRQFPEIQWTELTRQELMLSIADTIMKEEGINSIEDWLENHYTKSTVCTLALWYAGFKTRETTKYIKNRSGILECCDGYTLTLRDLYNRFDTISSYKNVKVF